MPPQVFENLFDLARLPWFDLRDGRVVVSDRTVGPVIDMSESPARRCQVRDIQARRAGNSERST
jgi:hypothetical protein